nr:MAG TPA: hypothetical protein [Caudoviricetes sp.]
MHCPNGGNQNRSDGTTVRYRRGEGLRATSVNVQHFAIHGHCR